MRASSRAALACRCLRLLLALAAPAQAGSLAVELACQSQELAGGGLALQATVRNRGEEAAHSLQAVPLYPPGGSPSPRLASLAGGQSAGLGLSWGLAAAQPGRRCAVLRLDLRDQEQMPLSALGYACQDPLPGWQAPLSVLAPPLELAGAGRLTASLKNLGAEPLALTVRAFAPRELEVWPPVHDLTIPPGQAREITWRMDNLGGQARASYPVLILSSLEQGGRRGERVDEVMVTLLPLPNPFRDHLGWWLAALVGLGLWLGAAQLRARRP